MSANPGQPKLRVNSYDAADRKPNQKEPGCWWRAPGRFAFYVMVHTALVAIARRRGWETNRVEYIRVGNVEGDPLIYIWPTDEHDPDRIPLRRYRSHLSANLSTVMVNWGLALPTGQRNRYDLLVAEPDKSPVGPALYLDKDRVLETRWEKRAEGSSPRRSKQA
ncbi:MAG: hypothetical protein ACOY93_03410 [Bacillota bacterium]